ncbi:hypothetical protein RRG08_066894 [Elysia crispata]|uniref:Uncharacterized protein n=1 Tax=Elysia crispata TaxID=231223 RepID=A0AAE0Z4K3_9GAST|nr:hypothetical protein RRG08_066894 [Elysia crispata]
MISDLQCKGEQMFESWSWTTNLADVTRNKEIKYIVYLPTQISFDCNVLWVVKHSNHYLRLYKSLHISARIFTVSEDCNKTIGLTQDKEQTFPMSLLVLLLIISCWTPGGF